MTADSALYIPPYKADDQDIVVELNSRFGAETFTVQPTRTGMPVLWVPRERLIEVLTFLRQVPKPYVMLYDLHGVDERLRTHRRGLPSADFSVFYHLMSLERNSDVMIKVALSERDLNLPTATRIWPNANWYEREVWDMYGITFTGHPHLTRMLMPPTWQGHPLRKDYPARATEFDPYSLSAAKQDLEQEALRFKPEDWGMKRHGENEDYMFLNLGPNHPSAHGAFRIILQLDGEEIIDCVPEIGYHHRGAEKMAERQSWHSFIPYTDRIDYLGGVMNNLPYVLSVEKLAGIKVPQRVDVIRIMMAEFFRILNHLLYLGTYIQDVGAMTPVFFTFTDRQRAYKVVEAITGFRLHPAWYRIGGVAHDLPRGWDKLVREFLDWMPKRLDEYETAALKNSILRGLDHRRRPVQHQGSPRVGHHRRRPARHRLRLRPAQGPPLLRLRELRVRGTAGPQRRRLRPLHGQDGRDAPEPADHRTVPEEHAGRPVQGRPSADHAAAERTHAATHRNPDHPLPAGFLGPGHAGQRSLPDDRGDQGYQQLLPDQRRQHHELPHAYPDAQLRAPATDPLGDQRQHDRGPDRLPG